LCLITSHDCRPQGSSLRLPAFMLLTFEADNNSLDGAGALGGLIRLSGSYFVSGQSDDELFQAHSGRIVFTRLISP
jgi:hypothetical protein